MKIIKNFDAFANESISSDVQAFIDAVHTVEKNNRKLFRSYSVVAQDVVRQGETTTPDADRDQSELLAALTKLGYDEQRIKKLYRNHGPEMLKSELADWCAVLDVLLYKLSSGRHLLSGIDYRDFVETAPDGTHGSNSGTGAEVFIKYSYGWHKTKYGKILIDQQFGGMKEFWSWLAADYKMHVSEELGVASYDALDGVIVAKGPLITIDCDALAKLPANRATRERTPLETVRKDVKDYFGEVLPDSGKVKIDVTP